MAEFGKIYSELNVDQKIAVDYIDGPLLVLAGPGTGKTQLLGARVANILAKTDTLPQNILCLTFTENGAANMRERLVRFIGRDAYNVNISTYHALGGDLIQRFPEYFARTRLENPIDELTRREIVAAIVEEMSYQNPLKQTQHHIGDLISTLSEVKRGLLDEDTLKQIASANSEFIVAANKDVSYLFEKFTSMPRKVIDALPYFTNTRDVLGAIPARKIKGSAYLSLITIVLAELDEALAEAEASSKTNPLTKWKNQWLAKDSDNRFIIDGSLQNKRIEALADVFSNYQSVLEARGLYDFDDMILRSIQALQAHSDLKFTLQEQYNYILLDEFQDTNAAQFQLVKLLSDNPVHEGRPNIMAVGDDDQAIYAFQGAHYSNMIDFYSQYRDVKVVGLIQNYRSHPDILHTAHNISEQIENRLHHNFQDMSKVLVAANKQLPKNAEVERHEFLSDIAEYEWIASNIEKKLKQGIKPSEIAVLAPRHKQLEPLVAYLNRLNIPVNYEKRENILDSNTIKSLVAMSRLVEALAAQDEMTASSLWPQILSYDFWQVPISTIWQVSWKVYDSHGKISWSAALFESLELKPIALLFLTLAGKFEIETAEIMLDYLIGTTPVQTNERENSILSSPFREYYSSKDVQQEIPSQFYEILSHLSVIRSRLREYQSSRPDALLLKDFLNFIALYNKSETRMINSSPYKQSEAAVQIMTVFKAKGLEFEYVYLPACVDNVWGESSRGNSNKLTLPANLSPIRHAGATQDERLRIFFVAITRAKRGLYLTSYARNYAGKPTTRLQYLNEQSENGVDYQSMSLPVGKRQNVLSDQDPPALHSFISNWHDTHTRAVTNASLRDLLSTRLDKYQLSPTHLNSFFDLFYGGPEAFFFNTIMRFPAAPTASGQFGNSIHETLQWLQQELSQKGKLPDSKAAIKYFQIRMVNKKLSSSETKLLLERGEQALTAYYKQRHTMYRPGNIPEHSFRSEGVFVGEAQLAGKIDLLEIDKEAKTITVVDYKTGASYTKWSSDPKLHKYKQQLYCYKILIENSHSYKGYRVAGGRLEFVEPNADGRVGSLTLEFTSQEQDRTQALIEAAWHKIIALDFPDISKYPASMPGIKQFEDDLLAGTI